VIAKGDPCQGDCSQDRHHRERALRSDSCDNRPRERQRDYRTHSTGKQDEPQASWRQCESVAHLRDPGGPAGKGHSSCNECQVCSACGRAYPRGAGRRGGARQGSAAGLAAAEVALDWISDASLAGRCRSSSAQVASAD
jgi:hypothetical protein